MPESACNHIPSVCLQVVATMSVSPAPVPKEWAGYAVYQCSHPCCGVFWLTDYFGKGFVQVTEAEAMALAYPARRAPV